VGWEVGYTGDMVRTLRCGRAPGQGHVSDKHETKVVHEDVSLTPISSAMPSGARAIGRPILEVRHVVWPTYNWAIRLAT